MDPHSSLWQCSTLPLLSPLFTYKLGFGSQQVYFTFYWSVRGNTDRKTKQNPSQNSITIWAKYLRESNIRVPELKGWFFLPYKAPSESLPALASDKIIWKLITSRERAVFPVNLRHDSESLSPLVSCLYCHKLFRTGCPNTFVVALKKWEW